MSEAQPGGFQPETGSDSFSIEGDGRRFFLDKGEKLTENPEGIKEFGGFINFRDTDGKEQKFPGGVVDGGDHWLVQRYDDKGDREYRIPKSGVVPEAGKVVAEGIVPVAEAPVGGLEDAAAVAAMEAPVGGEGDDFGGYRLAPDAKGGIANEEKLMGEIIGPDGQRFVGIVKRTSEGLKVVGAKGKEGFIKTPEKKIVGRIETPPAEVVVPSPEAAATVAAVEPPLVAESAPAPTSEQAVVEKPLEENHHPLVVELQQKMRDVYRPLRAARLWKQAENARARVEKTGSKTKIGELFTQEGELKRQAKELYPGIEKMTDAERGELSRKIVPLSAEGAAGAVRISSPRHREDMAVSYEAELQKWENILRDPGDFEQYRARTAEVESQKSAARQLFPEESDRRLLDQAIARIEERGSGRLRELESRLPRRLLELAGFISSESPSLTQVESDMDLRLVYNRAAQQLYEEITGAREKIPLVSVSEMPPVSVPEPVLPPEPISPPETVEQPVVEATVEGGAPVAEAVVEPEAVEQPAEVVLPPAVEEEVAPAPIEASVEAEMPGEAAGVAEALAAAEAVTLPPGESISVQVNPDGSVTVVRDVSEISGKPDNVVTDSFGSLDSAIAVTGSYILQGQNELRQNELQGKPADDRLRQSIDMFQRVNARLLVLAEKKKQSVLRGIPPAEAGLASAEPVAAPMPEAPVETPEQRFERRKQGFTGALAELDRARGDTSGTEGEQRVRLAEAFNQAIGAAMEFMEEGDQAREVVKEFLAGVLATSGGRKLTEVAVRSRMDETGVFQAATPEERKKKLEEAGLWGLITLLLELGMSFTDNAVGAIVSEVQSATGAGR